MLRSRALREGIDYVVFPKGGGHGTTRTSAMSKVRKEIEIAAPPERVWEVLIDPERLPQYNVAIVEIRDPTGPLD